MSSSPVDVYRARLRARQATLAQHERADARVAGARLAVVVMGVIAAAVAYRTDAVTPFIGLLAVPVFIVLAVVHERVLRAKARAQRAIAHVVRGIARIDDTWRGKGTTGERFVDDAHPFAADLDLFGRGSVFELLCTARTREGEARLAHYLTRPPDDAAQIRARQGAVRELAPLLDLREEIDALAAHVTEHAARAPSSTSHGLAASFGSDAAVLAVKPVSVAQSQSHVDNSLLAWAARPSTLPAWTLPAAALFVTTSIVAIALDVLDVVPRFVPLIALAAQAAFAGAVRKHTRAVLDGVDRANDELKVLAELLARVEGATFQAALLVSLQERLRAVGEPPSRVVARLTKHIDRLHQQQNQFFLPIAALLLWRTVHAALIARWRSWAGPKLPDWIDVVAEVEALLSLSAYAYEHPDDPEPAIVDGAPQLRCVALGHPLLPHGGVRNDVTLGGDEAPRLYVVSGSNMSGKSTFLRSIGVNAALALAGGRVRAQAMTVSPMAMGATLRVQDSLEKGASRFYAEISRLQVIITLARERNGRVLFLVDELLAGTNSRDREVGGAAILQGLVSHGSIGLATTHDLALASVADALGARARNVHFQDVLEGERVVFDYKLRDGVVQRSNALALMRAVGLDVGP